MSVNGKAVVLLSGGQDSTTSFYYALHEYDEVHAVSFDYGQRHRVELDLAASTAAKHDVPHVVLSLRVLEALGQASLTNTEIENTEAGEPASGGWHAAHGLPPSFVPGRNLLFFTLGAAYGIPRGLDTLVTGVCATDRAGYPDCRAEFVDRMELTIRVGMDEEGFNIDAPLLDRSKAETWQLADELGVLDEIIHQTHTCYEGLHSPEHLHEWGYGCGVCGACVERQRGFDEFRAAA